MPRPGDAYAKEGRGMEVADTIEESSDRLWKEAKRSDDFPRGEEKGGPPFARGGDYLLPTKKGTDRAKKASS